MTEIRQQYAAPADVVSKRLLPSTSTVPTVRSRRRRLITAVAITDYLVIVAAVMIGLFAEMAFHGHSFNGIDSERATAAALMIASWAVVLEMYRTREQHVFGYGSTEYNRIVSATAIATGLIAVILLLAHVDVGRGVFLTAIPLGLVGLLLERSRWRHWLGSQPERGRALSRVLIVGERGDVRHVAEQLSRRTAAAYSVVGAVVTDDEAGGVSTTNGLVPVVGDAADISEIARRLDADTVVMASQPHGGAEEFRRLSWSLEGSPTRQLVIASPLSDVAGPRIRFRSVEGAPLVHIEIPRFAGGKHVAKRAFDIAFSVIALTLLSPLLALLALAVRFDSPGGAIFAQARVGRGNEFFRMFKFRSMCADAEAKLTEVQALNEGSGPLFKLREDPRVTRVGRLLRRYSLDELPQFWNVLRGEMSVVGPRPPLPSEVEAYGEDAARRLFIKPGLTGMWQVNGRSDLSWEESVRLDLYYVENWSLMGDLILVWRTVKLMLRPVGAY